MFGGARSLVGNARMGGAVIGDGVRTLSDATRSSLQAGRYESFSQAMARLGVTDDQLPIVHNQLLLQLYLTFFVSIAAFTSCANLILNGAILASIVAGMIGIASLTKTVQSSMQCEFIRERKLGLARQWWQKPSVWLPNRMAGVIPIPMGDPLRDPKIVAGMVKGSRRRFLVSGLVLTFAVCSHFVFNSWGWPLLALGGAIVFAMMAANDSFEIFKRRQGHVCDLYPWLISPKDWVPSNSPPKSLTKTPVAGASHRSGGSPRNANSNASNDPAIECDSALERAGTKIETSDALKVVDGRNSVGSTGSSATETDARPSGV